MLKTHIIGSLVLSLLLSTTPLHAQTSTRAEDANTAAALPSMYEPNISPDGSEIAFVSGGDIWTVAAAGGEARLLVSHTATESRPVYSPDGRRLAFVSTRTGAGDIYVLDFASGDLARLTFDDAFDSLDAWSPDSSWIYFSSTRGDIAGMNDIYRVGADGGTPMSVSADRYTNEFYASPAPDGATLAFNARGISSSQWWRRGSSHLDQSELHLLRDMNGSAPAQTKYAAVSDAGARESWAMWSRDGRELYYVSDRTGSQNLWTRDIGNGATKGANAARQLTRFQDGRVLFPSISADGRTIVFERDFRIWRFDTRGKDATPIAITRRGAPATPATERLRLTDGIQELALSPDGKKIAFIVRGEVFAAAAKEGGDAVRVTNTPAYEAQVAWSPDSERLAYVSNRNRVAQIFIYNLRTNTEEQLTSANINDAAPRYSPDGTMVAFERGGRELRAVNIASKSERVLATGNLHRQPFISDAPFAWSPDNRWIAYTDVGDRLFRNVRVARVDSSSSAGVTQPVSFLANVGGNTVTWSPDGTFLLYSTGQRTESGGLARIDLIPRTPLFREDQFRDLFREETPRTVTPGTPQQEPTPTTSPTPTQTPSPNQTPTPSQTPGQTPTPAPSPEATPSTAPATQPTPSSPDAPGALLAATSGRASGAKPVVKPVQITFENIRQRLSLLPVGVDVSYARISPDGKTALLIGVAAGQQNLYTYSLDELAREPAIARQLTSTPGNKSDAQWSPDGKEVFYIEQGRINVVPIETRTPRPVAVSAEMDVDFNREKVEVFAQAWSYLNDNFYDPNFHGVDWQATRARYEPQIRGARTPDEMRRLINLMVGELNASHLGIAAPAPSAGQPTQSGTTGRLGLRFDRLEYERSGKLRITEIIALSPAALLAEIKLGAYLLAVDSKEINSRTNLDELLAYKAGRRVVLTVADSADGTSKREIPIRPVNATTEKGLLYRQWVESNRAYVAQKSAGRLGYVHIFDMSQASLSQLYLDLDAENHSRDGVVIDVRNNNGGFVNVYAIDVFARVNYLNMTPRGMTASAPARTVLGQRALGRPTILVTNQHSLSDAEDFTEGYRSLRLGKVIGEPTSGWIIFTSNVPLVDGSLFRIPATKVTGTDGRNMELNPRQVDIPSRRALGETYAGNDTQLDAAVRELLSTLGGRSAAP